MRTRSRRGSHVVLATVSVGLVAKTAKSTGSNCANSIPGNDRGRPRDLSHAAVQCGKNKRLKIVVGAVAGSVGDGGGTHILLQL